MTVALPVRPASVPAQTLAWRQHGLALAAVGAALLLLFRHDAAAIVATWWTSTTFQHCFIVAAVIGWLVWRSRPELAALRPCAWSPGLVFVGAGAAAWLAGAAGAATVARQLGLVVMAQGAVVTLLGPRVARGLAFPLGYALFLVPFGEWMEVPLQAVTVRLALPLLHIVGIPAVADGVVIHAGRYWFEVAEACAGAKFVIAMAAMGVLVAGRCFSRWSRRLAFLAISLVVPVLANGVRAAATMAVANWAGVERAAGFDHVVYGWLWFGVVMAAVLAIGWRWFDKPADAPAFDPRRLQRPVGRRLALAPAAALVVAVAATSAGWGDAAAARSTPLPARLSLPAVPGWRLAPSGARVPWVPVYPDADRRLIGHYVDEAGDAVDVAVALYEGQRDGRSMVAYGHGAVGEGGWLRVADLPPVAGAAAMRIAAPGPVERVVTTRYVVAGVETDSPVVVRLATLRAHLIGGSQIAVAVHLSAERRPGRDPVAAIERFAAALPRPLPITGRRPLVVSPPELPPRSFR